MRIGIDARMYSSQYTGIGRYTYELIQEISRMDTKNEYIIFLNPTQHKEFISPSSRVKKVSVAAPHYSLAEQTTFADILFKHNIDLMHFTHFNAPYFYRKSFVVTIHDLTLSFYKGNKRTSFIQRAAYNIVIKNVISRAQHIIAVSEHTKEDIRRLFFIPKEKITVIYEGIGNEFRKIDNLQRLDQTKKMYGLDKPFLLYTGVWRNHKNITSLIEAFSILLKQQNRNILLVITGKEDPFYPEVKELPKKLGIEQSVRLVGFVPEEQLIDLYNLATVFVFPSLYEGFGLPILESMACGTPVAASNASSIPEIGGDACLYFNPHDVSDIANKIATILDNTDIRTTLIEKGNLCVKPFSWQKMAQSTLSVYQSVLLHTITP